MTVSLFSVVVGDNDTDRLEAYLYAHTTLLGTASVGRRTAYLLRTTVDDSDEAVDCCGYLARYQVGRLQSGLYGERTTGRTKTAALNELKQWLDAEVDTVHKYA